MSVPQRIQRMVDTGLLQELDAPDADVAALWQKGVASVRDSHNAANSSDNQYVLGYQALLQMGTAILACAGYRTRGAQGHHANTFHAVAALGITGLEEIHIRTERVRKMRKLSAYEPGSPAPEQIDALNVLLDAVMPPAQHWLATQRPAASFPSYEPKAS
ncbi:MAG TPA: hypothetical protein VEY93_16815 [Longimicrobium sp.]|nr:hypothetical protein [Longimicrobium sp.]